MELYAVFAFILALFLSMVMIPPLVRLAGPLHLVDMGGERKIHRGSVPRIGGVAIVVGSLIPILLWVPLDRFHAAFTAAVILLFVFGLLDDRFNIDYRLKLLGQILAASIVVAVGGVLIEEVPLSLGGTLPAFVAVPLTIIALAGFTNAVNLSDGLDGLAGGIALLAISALLILLIADAGTDGSILVVLTALGGSILGFLRFNSFPARLFMGDTGSQFLGFSTGVLAIAITQREDLALSPLLPLLVLGLPILDTLTVMVRRMARGQSPFKADRTHLHHRLIDAGLNQAEAVSLIYLAQFVLSILAYVLRHHHDFTILIVYGVFCLILLTGIHWLEHRYRILTARGDRRRSFIRLGAWARKNRPTALWPVRFLRIIVPVTLVSGALLAPAVEMDIGLLASGLLCVTALFLVVKPLGFLFIEQLVAFTTAVILVYAVAHSPALRVCPICIGTVLGLITLSGALWVRLSSSRFQVSALDLLILLGALTAPTLRGLGLQTLGIQALSAIVLFYAIEILMQERTRAWDGLRIGILSTLAVVAYKSLMA